MMAPMTTGSETTSDDARYLALQTRDSRFDGRFFTGVLSTKVYCRPVCKVRLPRRENCQFFELAAQAEQAGFRPCLRCRPELAPAGPSAVVDSRPWSMQDASAILAQQAARLLDSPEPWCDGPPSARQLAVRLGIGERHVRRIFEALGYEVVKLDRMVFAGLTKKDLPRGRWRFLTEKEVNFLKMIK